MMSDDQDDGQNGSIPAAAVLLIIVGLAIEGTIWTGYIASWKKPDASVQVQTTVPDRP